MPYLDFQLQASRAQILRLGCNVANLQVQLENAECLLAEKKKQLSSKILRLVEPDLNAEGTVGTPEEHQQTGNPGGPDQARDLSGGGGRQIIP